MNRRHAASIAAVALAGAAGGAGLWHWRSSGDDDAASALWSIELDRPEGGRLALASLRGQALVLNFWATWCPPCVREMPMLDRFHRAFAARGGQVVGIAADSAPAVREFLKRTPVGFPIGLAGFGGIDLSRRLGNVSGGLPFTVVLDRRGQVLRRHAGESSAEDLMAWTQGIT